MRHGRVYLWIPDPSVALGGHVRAEVTSLERLDESAGRLDGRFARVRNGGEINVPDEASAAVLAMPIGDAQPDERGDFLFEPGRGGGRLDKLHLAPPDVRWRAIQAAHFGEVNTYYHLDRIAAYVDGLLRELAMPSLPPVVAVVNAHHAATEFADGSRDGVPRGERWLPFQGGHYRLPSRNCDPPERAPISPDGEIHLGPGWRLVEYGALVEAAGGRYRANASHNAGIIYHEYGHHIARHTADFKGNALRRPDRQNNRKTALDEGTADYWAATMLDTPHIWAWHRRHDEREVHARSLVSAKMMADYDASPRADPHANGTIWAASLWDVRQAIRDGEGGGARAADLLVLQALLLIGRLSDPLQKPDVRNIRRARKDFSMGLAALLEADARLYSGRYSSLIAEHFARRGVLPASVMVWDQAAREWPDDQATHHAVGDETGAVRAHVAAEEIPESADVLSASALEARLTACEEPPYSLIVGGDIMLGGRASRAIAIHGDDYPLAGTRPLLQRARIVLGNLEGPFARVAQKEDRTYSYRVNPARAHALRRAGITALTLANNHLLDCGRAGVLETLNTLAEAGIAALGAGVNVGAAHAPVIQQAGDVRVGLLGYYWNTRTAARANLPGSAMDTPAELEAGIRTLREQVDRVVVTFHWGTPYEREPQPDDRVKARFAVDCGADAVIGHHPHVAQPFEIYRGRPIFYSVGNWAFGSGNSKAEGLLIGLRFDERRTRVGVYPIYVKNRDSRVNYQPKALDGAAAERALRRLADMSGPSGVRLHIERGRGCLDLDWPGDPEASE